AVDAQLQALVLREEILERLFDGLAPLQVLACLDGVVAISSPEGGQGLGIALVKRLDEGLRVLRDGGLVFGITFALVGRGRPGAAAEKHGGDCQEAEQSRSHLLILSHDRGLVTPGCRRWVTLHGPISLNAAPGTSNATGLADYHQGRNGE